MYKILIADDEGIVRDSLKYIIEKDFSDCEIYLAKSGRQAIEIAEEYSPDIALLDIQMPGINGLSALREIKAVNKKVRALILTAYDNFDYAKEAVELGATDYIMKPIDRKKIDDTFLRLMHDIEAERQKRQYDLCIREKMEAVIPIIENGFVLSLIIKNEYNYSGAQYRELLDLKEEYGFIIVLEWGEGFMSHAPGNPVGSSVRAHKFVSGISEQIRTYFKAYLSNIMGNKIVAVIPSETDNLSYEDRLRMIEKVRSLTASLKEMVSIDFKAGIGSVRTWDDAFESYQEALNALRHGVRKVTHVDDLYVRDTDDRQYADMKKALLDALMKGSDIEVGHEAEAYLSRVFENNDDLVSAKMELLEVYIDSCHLMEERGKYFKDDFGPKLIKASDAQTLRDIFIMAVQQLKQEILIQSGKQNTVISKAQEYMKKYYNKDISLEATAETVNISPYYFSKLFKEETGINFSDYLTELRINRAKELINQDPDRNIKEVSIEAGYSNPNYFSRIFKKWTGMTPTELRDSIKAEV
ncbi:MAG: response regulator [Lachnospiraceae bacterium]|jgi:two-component system response regulator YesN|nr:response regulator [Lachnospiraceae bacterium]